MNNQGFKVGDRVQIIAGREAGHVGMIVLILTRRRGPYVIELANGRRAYCAASEMMTNES